MEKAQLEEVEWEKEEWENFYNSTTLHGFRFLFVPGMKWRRTMWTIILLTSLVAVTYQLTNSIKKYRSYPTATSIQEVFPESLDFPALSMCYRSPILLNKLTKHEKFKAYLQKKNKTDWTPSLVIKFLKEKRKETHYRELVREVSQDDKWFIRSTTFNKKSFTLEDFQFVLHGSYDFCYSFNNNASTGSILKTTSDTTGSKSGFSAILKLPNEDKAIPEMTRGHSVKFLLHQPGEYPQLDKGFYIPAGFAAYIAVKKKTVSLLRPPFPRSQCTPRKLSLYGFYSQQGCNNECWQNMTLKLCNCSNMLYAKGLAEECPSSSKCKDKEMLNKCRESCIEGCETIKYEYTVSYRHIFAENDGQQDWMKAYGYDLFVHNNKHYSSNYDFVRRHYVWVHIYYEDVAYTEIKQVEAYDLVALLGDLGGQLGLFIGASLITWMEFLDMFIIYVYGKYKEKRRFGSKASFFCWKKKPKITKVAAYS